MRFWGIGGFDPSSFLSLSVFVYMQIAKFFGFGLLKGNKKEGGGRVYIHYWGCFRRAFSLGRVCVCV